MTKTRPRRHRPVASLILAIAACFPLCHVAVADQSSSAPLSLEGRGAGGEGSTSPDAAAPGYSGAGSISPPPASSFPADQYGLPTVEITNPLAGLTTDPFVPAPSMPPGPSEAPAPTIPPPSTVAVQPPPSGAQQVSPQTFDEDHAVILDNADAAEQIEAGRWILMGDVRLRYQKYVVNADRADIDTDAQTALFSGHVRMTAPTGEVVDGGKDGTLKIDLDNDSYVLANAEAVIPQSRFGIGLIEPLYVYDGVVRGQPDFIDARGCSFTTCDFVDPHYHFKAEDMYIIPGRKLVAKRVSLYRRDHRIITWPYLVVPLDQRASTLNPQFGETPEEGYFAKFAVGYLLSKDLPGILHIDAYSKLGLGLGVDQSYGNPSNPKDASGTVSLYELPNAQEGTETITASINHRQQIGTVSAGLNAQFENDSFLLGNTSSQNLSTQLSLNRNVGNLTTAFSTNLSESNYSGDTSSTLTSSLDEIFAPTTRERFETKFDLSNYSTSFGGTSTSTSQLNSDLEYDEQDPHFDWKLMANKYSTLGGSDASALGGVEKMPEFDLSTDPIRAALLKSLLPKVAKLNFSYGSYFEPASNMQGQRLNFELDTGTNTFKINSWQAVDLEGDYLQRFYSDNAAQYILTNHDTYRLRIGQKSTASLKYDYLRPYGFTPFEFDFSGVTNLLSANLAYQETSAFQMTLSTGYDINAARQTGSLFGPPQPWQDIALQSQYTPTKYFLWHATSSYDLNHGQLIDFTNNWSIRGRDEQALDLGARYAPQQHRVSAITEEFDIPLITDKRESSGWRLQTIAGYDGLTDGFDYSGVAVTRSWHDWEATLIYQDNPIGFQTGSSFTFNIRLKAFPGYSPFGTGNFGQSLSPALGTVY